MQPEYDDIKAALLMLYPVHCPWNVLDGKPADDTIGKMIDRI